MSANYAIIVPTVSIRDTTAANDAEKSRSKSRESNLDVRRPLDAVTVPDDSYATISLLSGGDLLNTSVAQGTSASNANILIQSLSFSVAEKHQRAQTFDKDRIFFFGQALPSLRVEATTLDSLTFQWLQELYENYATRISGTISAEQGAKVQLTSDERVYTGYILELSFTKNVQVRATANVTISMALTDLTHLRELQSTAASSSDESTLSGTLEDISSTLASAPNSGPTEANISLPLSQQVPSENRSMPIDEGDASASRSSLKGFSEVYFNEYPNRPARSTRHRNVLGSNTIPLSSSVPDELSNLQASTLAEVQECVSESTPNIIILQTTEEPSVAQSDLDIPSVIPTASVVPKSVAEARSVTDDVSTNEVPNDIQAGLDEGNASINSLVR